MNLTGISRRSLAQNRHSPVNKNVPKRSNHVWEKDQKIIAALEKDPHASRVARALGDVSYATASRIADRNAIALAAGRETMGAGCRRTGVRRGSKDGRANADAPQNEIAQRAGV